MQRLRDVEVGDCFYFKDEAPSRLNWKHLVGWFPLIHVGTYEYRKGATHVQYGMEDREVVVVDLEAEAWRAGYKLNLDSRREAQKDSAVPELHTAANALKSHSPHDGWHSA